MSSSLSDARDALVNAVVDLVSAYKGSVSNLQQSGLVLPASMCLFPVYILALLKQVCYFTHWLAHHTHSRTLTQTTNRNLMAERSTGCIRDKNSQQSTRGFQVKSQFLVASL